MKRSTFLAAAGLALACAATGASAQAFPSKPIRMLVPFPAGAATDMAARVIGQQLSASLGQPVVIENKPGAGGSIAAMEVIRSAPDGYTLLFSSNSALASNVALLKNIPYDPNKDFTPIAGTGETVLVLLVKSGFPVKNVKELVAYIKTHPGKVSAGYGSSSSQISIATLDKLAGTQTLLVPYKGIPLAVNDVLGGTLDYTFADVGNALAQVKGGNMRALGVTSRKRTPLMADVPAIAEVLPGFDITAWFGIVGPAGMPREVVDKLNAATTQALKAPEMKDKLAGIGLTPMPMAPEQLKAFIGTEVVKWTRLAREANIQPE
ncbi:Bug family tripartite tricarboxylate transporter substrate binding protein [Caenimonas terrae]|uniref:Bug family tripartite tricarboxylate transporter substrate binding protein n=1 Tax=Caenimonas terrae TaxID=696074 RepID=A0ABW0NCL7_9BURK